jgi:hypothetical protein
VVKEPGDDGNGIGLVDIESGHILVHNWKDSGAFFDQGILGEVLDHFRMEGVVEVNRIDLVLPEGAAI